jgi:hypothetical protein
MDTSPSLLDKKEATAMASDYSGLLTAGNIAKALGVSDAKVKKAIQHLGIKPEAKKGVCNYYAKDVVKKIKGALN